MIYIYQEKRVAKHQKYYFSLIVEGMFLSKTRDNLLEHCMKVASKGIYN